MPYMAVFRPSAPINAYSMNLMEGYPPGNYPLENSLNLGQRHFANIAGSSANGFSVLVYEGFRFLGSNPKAVPPNLLGG